MIYPNENQTSEAVAKHYNSLDQYYRKLWGEHLHHGYFHRGNETVEQATEALIDLVIKAGRIEDNSKVLDVGCGYGATARFLAHGLGAFVTALTVSKSQWQYARSHDPESTNPRYILGDFLHHTIPEHSYDAIISIETSEHMVEKEKYFAEVTRLLKPGGRFVTCACLAKEDPTPWQVKHLLEPICREGRIPSLGTMTEYQAMIEGAGLKEVEFRDLSQNVKKTWSICAMRTSKAFLFDKHVRRMLLDKGFSERIFAKTLFRILTAYNAGAMRYGLFSAIKP